MSRSRRRELTDLLQKRRMNGMDLEGSIAERKRCDHNFLFLHAFIVVIFFLSSLLSAIPVTAICISNASIKPNSANCLVFFPPRSLNADHVSSVCVLQLCSNVAVYPPGMVVTYLSAPCDDTMQGKNLLQSAIDILFSVPVSGSSANSTSADENKNDELYLKPFLLWSAFYIQELTSLQGIDDSIFSTQMPDGDLHFNNIVDVTKKLFQKMYPGDEFFATANSFNEVDGDFGPEVEEL
ncbi:G-protein modulator [Lithospermum erythrorhizon]|uniref:G-protein modulator n=1 Tax=Lithospermum erythrorhizon TaxID=34254 RepID=A0AAV3QR20_LITER